MESYWIDLKCSSPYCQPEAWDRQSFGAKYQTLFSTMSLYNTLHFYQALFLLSSFFLITIVVGVECFGVWDWVFRGLGHAVPSLLVFLGSGSVFVYINMKE